MISASSNCCIEHAEPGNPVPPRKVSQVRSVRSLVGVRKRARKIKEQLYYDSITELGLPTPVVLGIEE